MAVAVRRLVKASFRAASRAFARAGNIGDPCRHQPDTNRRAPLATLLVTIWTNAAGNDLRTRDTEATRIAELRAVRQSQRAIAERRRLERNLHDGAQQRLVTVALQLRLLHNRI